MTITKDAIQELAQAQAITSANEALTGPAGAFDSPRQDMRVATLPQHFTLHDLEKFFPGRRRPRGAMTTSTVADFAGYVQQNAREGTAVFIDQQAMRAEAVLNLGTAAAPGHADDVAQLKPRQTAAFAALLAHANGQGMAQRIAAEFLEDWMHAIECMKDAAKVTTPLAIEAVRSITIDAQRKGTNTEQSLGVQRSTFESVQAGSEKPLPTHIYFTAVPYHGLAERQFVLRLGVLTGDKPAVVLRIVNKELHEEQMAAELAAQVRQALPNTVVLLGTYSPKA
jgi:uncharacterized protein YfdQ (DUF2303 family)